MKNLILIGGFFCLGALSSILYTNYSHREKMSLNKTVVRLSALRSTDDQDRSLNRAVVALDKNAIKEASKSLPLDSESFAELVFGADRLNIMSMEGMIQRLRANDSKLVAQLFVRELEDIGPADPEARSQLVFAANKLQSDELLSFWRDLALRTTPRNDDEAEVLGLTELTLDAKVIHGEMATAIRNIGLIAYRDHAARAVLERIVLHPQPLSHPTFVREYAFHALKEADESAVLRLLRGIPAADPLRDSLKTSISAR